MVHTMVGLRVYFLELLVHCIIFHPNARLACCTHPDFILSFQTTQQVTSVAQRKIAVTFDDIYFREK